MYLSLLLYTFFIQPLHSGFASVILVQAAGLTLRSQHHLPSLPDLPLLKASRNDLTQILLGRISAHGTVL